MLIATSLEASTPGIGRSEFVVGVARIETINARTGRSENVAR
jgi:hypothetical protein